MAEEASVVDRVLTICINMRWVQSLIDQELDNFSFPVTTGVIERSLLKAVLVVEVDTILDQLNAYLNSNFFIFDLDSSKIEILVELSCV